MKKKGKVIICDRCGETEFVELVGQNFYDGGYSCQDRFAEPTIKWEFLAGYDFCEKCAEQYRSILNGFVKNGK